MMTIEKELQNVYEHTQVRRGLAASRAIGLEENFH